MCQQGAQDEDDVAPSMRSQRDGRWHVPLVFCAELEFLTFFLTTAKSSIVFTFQVPLDLGLVEFTDQVW